MAEPIHFSFISLHNPVVIHSLLDTMKIGGSMAYTLVFLLMILIAHQSFAYYEYEPNARNSKIEIDLNVNFNINGLKPKQKTSGNLSFKGLSINDIFFLLTLI